MIQFIHSCWMPSFYPWANIELHVAKVARVGQWSLDQVNPRDPLMGSNFEREQQGTCSTSWEWGWSATVDCYLQNMLSNNIRKKNLAQKPKRDTKMLLLQLRSSFPSYSPFPTSNWDGTTHGGDIWLAERIGKFVDRKQTPDCFSSCGLK